MRFSSSGRLGQYLLCLALCHSALPGAGYFLKRSKESKDQRKQGSEYVPAGGGKSSQREPSCEELREMWRFSKRQSRAAEITNEIPSYRDPFAYSVWEPYPSVFGITPGMKSRAGPLVRLSPTIVGDRRSIVPADRATIERKIMRARQQRPVYGRVLHAPPPSSTLGENATPENVRAFRDLLRQYELGGDLHPTHLKSHKTLRFPGNPLANSQLSGRFQEIKDILRAERARELKERIMEEREANRGGDEGTYRSHVVPTPHSPFDSIRFSEGRFGAIAPDRESRPRGPLTFPDVLAPSANAADDVVLVVGNPIPPSLTFPKTVTPPTMPNVEDRNFGDNVRYVERGGRSYKHHRMTTGHKGHPQGHIRDDYHMARLHEKSIK
ncbi:hypothetical protein J437_LFUL013513 [Ladona fulva]|uniref:Uncharacterized protein n=1 Tax=Ladona fulva TaxID=123851 RepID=A0A8K0KGH4_LADFU|nr:hypothetical protein J437_LFUL013513 [Ladona fulva]